MRVLGIESSCDETGVAVVDSERGLLAHRLHSQAALHADYGGVVPELASRDHIRKTVPLIRAVLAEAGASGASSIDALAYTAGPGLMGALLVGASIARSLAWGWDVPAVGVHHMEAHLLAPMLEPEPPRPPFVALLVSGGHTMLVHVETVGRYLVLGESLDDAAGEAFDKTAQLLGLGYPGGPALAALAERGDPQRFTFPRPMSERPGLDFSFSGLKTHAAATLRRHGDDPQTKADIARALEHAIAKTLSRKCRRALDKTGCTRLIAAGGVAANRHLRRILAEDNPACELFFPRLDLCTDNGAMIAYAGLVRLTGGHSDDLTVQARPRWPLTDLPPLAAD